MRLPKIKVCALSLLVGALFWAGSECIEIMDGSVSPLVMFLTGIAFLGLCAGVWSIHAGQATQGDMMGLIGVASMSIASFILMFSSFTVLSQAVSYESLAATNWFFVFFFFWIFGTPLVGFSIIRARVFPVWTGGVLILAPLVTTVAFIGGLPPIILNVSNMAHNVCFILFAGQLLLGKTEPSA